VASAILAWADLVVKMKELAYRENPTEARFGEQLAESNCSDWFHLDEGSPSR